MISWRDQFDNGNCQVCSMNAARLLAWAAQAMHVEAAKCDLKMPEICMPGIVKGADIQHLQQVSLQMLQCTCWRIGCTGLWCMHNTCSAEQRIKGATL